MTTKEQIKATVATVMAVAEAVRELKRVPSGTLYAQLMGHMDLATFNRIVDTLKGAGVVAESNHMLLWTGPQPGWKAVAS